jgi:hypothetical protein
LLSLFPLHFSGTRMKGHTMNSIFLETMTLADGKPSLLCLQFYPRHSDLEVDYL